MKLNAGSAHEKDQCFGWSYTQHVVIAWPVLAQHVTPAETKMVGDLISIVEDVVLLFSDLIRDHSNSYMKP